MRTIFAHGWATTAADDELAQELLADEKERAEHIMLVDLARNRGITIVLVEHVMQLVMSVADRITVLNFGYFHIEAITVKVIRPHPLPLEN